MRWLLSMLVSLLMVGCAVDDATKTVATNCGICRLVWTASGYMVVCDNPDGTQTIRPLAPLERVK